MVVKLVLSLERGGNCDANTRGSNWIRNRIGGLKLNALSEEREIDI